MDTRTDVASSQPCPTCGDTDDRGRRIVFVAHCILNANAKVEGLALYEGVHPLVTRLAKNGVGIVQMRCAEMEMCGMKRWGQTREQYENPAFVAHCNRLARQTAASIEEYLRCGYEVLGIVGIDGSPTCGVDSSASGRWGGEFASGEALLSAMESVTSSSVPGVHMRALMDVCAARKIRFTALDESLADHGVERVLSDMGLE